MKLVFMGTPSFALPTLHALLASPSHTVGLVITQPDRPKGRGMRMQPPPVKEAALAEAIPVLQPERLKGNAEIASALETQAPDAVIVVAYGRIIPPELLAIPRHGCINVHASLLPRLRGAAPINWAILAGHAETGVSIMQLDAGLDTGPVYLEAGHPIREGDDAVTLGTALAELGAQKLCEVLRLIETGAIKPAPQDDAQATYAPLLKKEDGLIDWGQESAAILRRIRGLVPWPGAFTRLGEKILRIWKAGARQERHDHKPGTLLKADGVVAVACRGGFILPEALQLEGRQIMDARAFANGLRAEKIILGE